MRLTVDQIAAATEGKIVSRLGSGCDGVSTDSRSVESGKLFIPIVGVKFDGHDFIKTALERGAAGFVFAPDKFSESVAAAISKAYNAFAVSVKDTLTALGDLARYRRDSIPNLRVAAITGSTGKTTTKEMLAGILSDNFRVAKNEGNLNNLVGLPLSMLSFPDDAEIAVVEMGTNSPGEIGRLSEIASPDFACVTNVGPVHLEGLGSVKGVAKEKGALPRSLAKEGVFAANTDDPFVAEMAKETVAKTICYGLKGDKLDKCEKYATARSVKIKFLYSEFDLVVGDKKAHVKINAPGAHNVMNALAAAALATGFGCDVELIAKGVEKYRPLKMRSEIRKLANGVTMIVDCYNSNPVSLDAALSLLEIMRGRRIAVIGDMLELGDFSEEAHLNAGAQAARIGVDVLVAVGEMASAIQKGFLEKAPKGGQVIVAKDADEAAEELLKIIRSDDAVLVKGSRGVRLETVVAALEKKYGAGSKGDLN